MSEVNAEVFGVLDEVCSSNFSAYAVFPLLDSLSRILPGMKGNKEYLTRYFLVVEAL